MNAWESMTTNEQQNALDMITLQNLQAQQKQLGALASIKPQVDYSPLAALVDTWTGSKFAQTYQKPVSQEDRAKVLLAGNQNINDSLIDFLKTKVAEKKAEKEKQYKITGNQYSAAGYAARILDADKIISEIELDPMKFATQIQLEKNLPEFAMSDVAKKSSQAERNFINSVLRRESGATISPSEFSNARSQYLPQPGDSQEVLLQKKRNRQVVFESMRAEAGEAYDKLAANLGTAPTTAQAPLTMDDIKKMPREQREALLMKKMQGGT